MATLFVIFKQFYAHAVPGVSQLFHAFVRPRLRSFSILYLSVVLRLAYLAISFFSYRRFRPLKDQYKLLRVEKNFMNALIKDVEYVSDLWKKNRLESPSTLGFTTETRSGCTIERC